MGGTFGGRPPVLLWSLFFTFFAGLFSTSSAADSVDAAGSVGGRETLVSVGGRFEVGFRAPGGSTKEYLCVWATMGQEKPVVWVANRERSLNNSAGGVLRFGEDGNLAVLDGRPGGGVIWSTKLAPNAAGKGSRVAQLLDTGNLVVRDARDGVFLWQSFDEPGDTLLPGMKLLVNTRTGASRNLTSWKSADDPSPGKYTYGLEFHGLPRLVLLEGSSSVRFTTGLWNGIRFTGFPLMNGNGVFSSSVVIGAEEVYYTDSIIGNSSGLLLRVVATPDGQIRRHLWNEDAGTWDTMWSAPTDCQVFATCGPYGSCTDLSSVFPPCMCLTGFRPKSWQRWSKGIGSDGCVRQTKPDCGVDVFLPLRDVTLPELVGRSFTVSMDMNLEECRGRCTEDCSCTAFANADVRGGGRGCITWSGDLIDIKHVGTNGQLLYLRVAPSDVVASTSPKRSKKLAIIVSTTATTGILLLVLCGFWMRKRNKMRAGRKMHRLEESVFDKEDRELFLLDYGNIALATNNFSDGNKIGEGGFGVVYKGLLEGGQEIAVKRLSSPSVQGMSEFINEVKLLVKLQHKNLVQLLGCCIQGDERILVFEYMQNKSLDLMIFDEAKRGQLGWRMRLDIILGIARGLLYLHQDSRLKIIHRDLKTGNILLDDDMIPKISDFGTAKIFGTNQHIHSTKRVIGTFGYMSPEYAMNGIVSVKSDVFSFGVLTLEILSGTRSRGIFGAEPHSNLLSHAWTLWQEGNCLELLDPMVSCECYETELLRYIQVSLLCIQELARDRPSMSAVIMMLGSENFPLPDPRKPGFLVSRGPYCTRASGNQESSSTNEITCTSVLEGR